MLRLAATLVTAAALTGAAAGCGLGAGATLKNDPVSLTVTRDFGAGTLVSRTAKDAPKSETVMRLLERNAKVTTRYGGGFVQCVNGLCGQGGGIGRDWFYFVNGSEAPKGAAATTLHGGDRVWWDRRDWGGAQRVPAVVGSFPEPFRHGTGDGKRLPVRLECVALKGSACQAVEDTLSSYDIPVAKGLLRSSYTQETLRVLVGPWQALREDSGAAVMEDGPQASGVFAEPRGEGDAIALMDASGHVARTLGPGSGLIAATAAGEDPPVWVVTGTDEAGIDAAARSFNEKTLKNRFAVAFEGGTPIALPVAKAAP